MLLTVVLICGNSLFTQVIEGNVLDEKSFPVSYATVCQKNTSNCSFSNSEGVFKINALLGDTVIITALGYKRKEFVLRENFNAYVLQDEALELDGIVIKGRSAKEEKEEEGYAVDVVETSQLSSQSIELNQILDQTAGVKVRQHGGLGSKANFTINGLSDKAVRVFLDGVPMDYFGSSYSISTLPISLIDRIEIYKGVVPIELGNDALGGAINLITKTNFQNSLEFAYSYGSFNTHRASLFGNWRDSLTGISVKASVFYNYSDNNYKVWGDDIYSTNPETFEIQRGIKVERFHDSFESKALKFDIGLTNKKWADQFYLGVLYSDMDKDIQHGVTMETPFGEATYHQKVVMPNLTFKKYDFLIKKLYANVFSSYSVLSRVRIDTSRNKYNWYGEVEGQRSGQGEQGRSLNTLEDQVFLNRINLTYDLNFNHKIGMNLVTNNTVRSNEDPLVTTTDKGFLSNQNLNKQTLGIAYENTLWDNKFQSSVFFKGFNYRAKVKDSETILGETSYFDISVSDFNLGYGFASSVRLKPNVLIKASAEKAIRMPDSEEVFGDGLNIISSSSLPDGIELKPEKSLNFNLGTQIGFIKNDENQLSTSFNLFYRNTSGLIRQRVPSQSTNINTFVFINIEKVLFKGVDFKLDYKHVKGLHFSQNVSYLIPTIKTEQNELGVSNITYDTRLSNIPFFQTNSSFKFSKEGLIHEKSNLLIYWDLAYVASFYMNNEVIGNENKNVIPAQWVHNAGVSYIFPNEKLSVSLDVRNIFNEQVFDNFAVQKPGRGAYVKVKYRIVK